MLQMTPFLIALVILTSLSIAIVVPLRVVAAIPTEPVGNYQIYQAEPGIPPL